MDRQQVALTASMAAAGEAYNQMAAKYDALAAEVVNLLEKLLNSEITDADGRAYYRNPEAWKEAEAFIARHKRDEKAQEAT